MFTLVSVGLYQGVVSTSRQRCAWVTCDPLTWAEIQALTRTAVVPAGPDYRLAEVFVDLPPGTPRPALGPLPLTVQLHYVDPDPVYGEYTLHAFTIDIRDQVGVWREVGYGGLPSRESQQRFARVRIGPQKVYALTWDRAQQALPGSGSHGFMLLAEFGAARPAPTWFIMYDGERSSVSYHVDPETGAIIDHTRTEWRSIASSTATTGPAAP